MLQSTKAIVHKIMTKLAEITASSNEIIKDLPLSKFLKKKISKSCSLTSKLLDRKVLENASLTYCMRAPQIRHNYMHCSGSAKLRKTFAKNFEDVAF